MRAAIVLCLVALGCGAKTGLESPPCGDRDGDGFIDGACGGDDCDDLDPSVHPDASERCTGGIDEDCDATFDCSDLDCAEDPVCLACGPERCTGGLDDDCDGDVDCFDDDCAALCCMPTRETCDGTDEDCDGVADDGVTCFFADGVPITALATTACGAEWYAYDSLDTASAAPVPDLRESDRVAVAIVDLSSACGGAAIAVIADQVRDGSGGGLEGTFSIEGTDGGIFVGDEPRECAWDASSGTGRCSWRWDPCCTDGVFLGPLGDDFCLTLTLDAALGVSRIAILDADLAARPGRFGVPIELCGRTVPAVP